VRVKKKLFPPVTEQVSAALLLIAVGVPVIVWNYIVKGFDDERL